MTLFEQIVNSVLNEAVEIGKVNDAIGKTYEVKINYQSNTDNASGERIIQPVAYGVTKAGKLILRAYQPFGDTQTSVPSWKLFSLSGIKKWKPLYDRKFTEPEGFNPNGDKDMATVYTIANFNKNQVKRASEQPKPVKASGPVTKNSISNNFKKYEPNNKNITKKLDNLGNYSDIVKDKNINLNQQQEKNSHMVAGSGPVTKNSLNNKNVEVNDVNNTQENNL